jgi:hypothetical protein
MEEAPENLLSGAGESEWFRRMPRHRAVEGRDGTGRDRKRHKGRRRYKATRLERISRGIRPVTRRMRAVGVWSRQTAEYGLVDLAYMVAMIPVTLGLGALAISPWAFGASLGLASSGAYISLKTISERLKIRRGQSGSTGLKAWKKAGKLAIDKVMLLEIGDTFVSGAAATFAAAVLTSSPLVALLFMYTASEVFYTGGLWAQSNGHLRSLRSLQLPRSRTSRIQAVVQEQLVESRSIRDTFHVPTGTENVSELLQMRYPLDAKLEPVDTAAALYEFLEKIHSRTAAATTVRWREPSSAVPEQGVVSGRRRRITPDRSAVVHTALIPFKKDKLTRRGLTGSTVRRLGNRVEGRSYPRGSRATQFVAELAVEPPHEGLTKAETDVAHQLTGELGRLLRATIEVLQHGNAEDVDAFVEMARAHNTPEKQWWVLREPLVQDALHEHHGDDLARDLRVADDFKTAPEQEHQQKSLGIG